MRLQLQGLREQAFRQVGKAAEPLRAGRQGHRPHAQAASSRSLEGGAPPAAEAPAPVAMPEVAARPLARQSCLRHVRLAPPPQQGRLGERHLAHRARSRRERARLRGRRQLRHFPGQRCRAGRRRARRARHAGRFPDRRPHFARGADRRRLAVARARHAVSAVLLSHRRRPAEEGEGAGVRRRSGWRRRHHRRARRACRNSPACGPTRKPSSSRSIRCSRASIRSRRRSRPIPAASRSRSMPCATRSLAAPGSASARPSSPTASRPATSCASMCRRPRTSRCRRTRRSRSS